MTDQDSALDDPKQIIWQLINKNLLEEGYSGIYCQLYILYTTNSSKTMNYYQGI